MIEATFNTWSLLAHQAAAAQLNIRDTPFDIKEVMLWLHRQEVALLADPPESWHHWAE